MDETLTIVGGSLAGMVAAQAAAARGRRVLLINPLPNWGGHLAGINVGGRQFDAGMVLFEFSSFNRQSSPDPRSYDPAVRNDCGRFVALVRDYVQQRVPMVQVPDPLLRHGSACVPDLIIGNHVESLLKLSTDLQQAIHVELRRATTDPDRSLHASRKNTSDQFRNADLATVSVRNHGATFHECFIEPLCRKILGVGSRDILALYHRAAWLPLYWPETLLLQLERRPSELPATHFHYPASGSAAALIDALREELLASEFVRIVNGSVTLLRETGGAIELTLNDGSMLEATEPVWAHDPAALVRLLAVADDAESGRRAGVGLCFFAVPEHSLRMKFSSLFVPDSAWRIYRVTNPDACAGNSAPMQRLVVEFGAADAAGSPSHADIAGELAELGVLDAAGSVLNCGMKLLQNALPLPDESSRRRFEEQHRRVADALPSVRLIGPAAGFLATSINDQIVQGLKVAAEPGTSR